MEMRGGEGRARLWRAGGIVLHYHIIGA